MIRVWRLFLAFPLMVMVLIMGCSPSRVESDAYRLLRTAQVTYTATMEAASGAYAQGLIDEAGAARLRDAGEEFLRVYFAAVDVYAAYVQGARGRDELDAALSGLSAALAALAAKCAASGLSLPHGGAAVPSLEFQYGF